MVWFFMAIPSFENVSFNKMKRANNRKMIRRCDVFSQDSTAHQMEGVGRIHDVVIGARELERPQQWPVPSGGRATCGESVPVSSMQEVCHASRGCRLVEIAEEQDGIGGREMCGDVLMAGHDFLSVDLRG